MRGKETKHSEHIQSLQLSSEELSKQISIMNIKEILKFLEQLGNKIEKDGLADKERGRQKLSTQLFACAEILKNI